MTENRIVMIDENGAVLREFDGSSHYVRSKEQDESFKRLKEKERNKDTRKFLVIYQKPIEELFSMLTLNERGMLLKLSLFLEYDSEGLLVKQGKPLKQVEFEKVLGRGKKAVREFVNKLESSSVVFTEQQGRTKLFYLNNELVSLGEKVAGSQWTKLFVVKARELTEKLSNDELGTLWSIIPFFHYESFILCKNPNEKNPARYEFLSVKELAEAVGVNEDTLAPRLKALRKAGVIMELRTGKSKTFKVNPNVIYRKSNWTQEADQLSKEFEMLLSEGGNEE